MEDGKLQTSLYLDKWTNLRTRARVTVWSYIAEYFRDGDGQGKGRDVLFFVDNIFRFTQAGSEVSALLGRIHQR